MPDETVDQALVLRLESLAANAWPAAEAELLDGWRLRFTQGVTRRANSVWPNLTQDAQTVAAKLLQVEQFYAARNLPARYQICPAAQPADLDGLLAKRGYVQDARTAVQATNLAEILRRSPPLRTQPSFEVEVSEEYADEWFAIFADSEQAPAASAAVIQSILRRIAQPVGFAHLRVDGVGAAVGLGVLEEEWLGVFCMATRPAYRRRGAANAILRTLAIWAQLYGAQQAYLQVMDNNLAAQSLYGRLGFATLYHYHYREQRF